VLDSIRLACSRQREQQGISAILAVEIDHFGFDDVNIKYLLCVLLDEVSKT
jgi:hypothetical protein